MKYFLLSCVLKINFLIIFNFVIPKLRWVMNVTSNLTWKTLFLRKRIMNKNDVSFLNVRVIDPFRLLLRQFFVITLTLARAIIRIMLSSTCEETTVWIAVLSITAGRIQHSPKLRIFFFSKTNFFSLFVLSGSGKSPSIFSLLKNWSV